MTGTGPASATPVLRPLATRATSRLQLVLLCALALAMLAPAAANAVVVDVNTNGDAPDMQADLSCDAAPADGQQCTLRAAIQTVNFSNEFSNVVTCHQLPASQHTITLGSQLPDIVKPAFVSGNGVACAKSFNPAPCVEVTYAAASGLPVLSFNLSSPPQGGQLIGAQALALTNGSVGLKVTGQTQDMSVTNMWLGLHLDATPGPNGVGVSIEGDSADGTVIGGAESVETRNVIAFNTMSGIDISAADDTFILGNYIGSKADGITQAGNGSASTNGENIEVTSNAENTRIGATLTGEAAASQACDGACNVIIDAGRDVANNYAPHIDLHGEAADGEEESSATTIRGNYIGLARDGATSISRGTRGIAVVVNGADGVTIGGPASGDRNRFHNNGTVVANTSGARDLIVQNNWVNLKFDGTAVDPDGLHNGIGMNLSGSDFSPPVITENRIAWAAFSNFPAITAHNESFVITNNVIGRAVGGAEIPGGGIGINIGNLTATTRTLVSGNTVDGVASGSSVVPAAIVINGSNGADIVGNVLDASGAGTGAHGDGIRIVGSGSAGNVIGGSNVDATNTITADRDAIRVSDAGALSNTFGRNVGTANADEAEAAPGTDLFIDLGTDGFLNNSSANGGIEAPEVEIAGATVVAGDADPEATIRVFTRPLQGSRDTVGAFLGATTADATGDWRLEYAEPQAGGVPVAATQTDGNGNSSELSPSVHTDAIPPAAPTITAGPAGPTTDTTPAFEFSGSEGGGTLLCSLDQGPAQACDGGTFDVVSPLADGPHVFRVIHEDAAGNSSAEASREFIVDTEVGRPRISGPPGLTRDRTPSFSFGVEDGASVTCTLDGAPVQCTASGFTPGPLPDGAHTVTVTQTDPAGNISEAAARGVRVDATPPQTLRLKGRISPFDRTPTFRFRSSEPGSTFRCKLNGGRWRPCRSPHTLRRPMRLTRPNVLRVRAVDRAGNPDPTPLRRVFRVRIRGAA